MAFGVPSVPTFFIFYHCLFGKAGFVQANCKLLLCNSTFTTWKSPASLFHIKRFTTKIWLYENLKYISRVVALLRASDCYQHHHHHQLKVLEMSLFGLMYICTMPFDQVCLLLPPSLALSSDVVCVFPPSLFAPKQFKPDNHTTLLWKAPLLMLCWVKDGGSHTKVCVT